jgi:hypothetical protein
MMDVDLSGGCQYSQQDFGTVRREIRIRRGVLSKEVLSWGQEKTHESRWMIKDGGKQNNFF